MWGWRAYELLLLTLLPLLREAFLKQDVSYLTWILLLLLKTWLHALLQASKVRPSYCSSVPRPWLFLQVSLRLLLPVT
jgi:hypothetical protein